MKNKDEILKIVEYWIESLELTKVIGKFYLIEINPLKIDNSFFSEEFLESLPSHESELDNFFIYWFNDPQCEQLIIQQPLKDYRDWLISADVIRKPLSQIVKENNFNEIMMILETSADENNFGYDVDIIGGNVFKLELSDPRRQILSATRSILLLASSCIDDLQQFIREFILKLGIAKGLSEKTPQEKYPDLIRFELTRRTLRKMRKEGCGGLLLKSITLLGWPIAVDGHYYHDYIVIKDTFYPPKDIKNFDKFDRYSNKEKQHGLYIGINDIDYMECSTSNHLYFNSEEERDLVYNTLEAIMTRENHYE